MTPKERLIEAFNLRQPDSIPTLELEFQLEEEMFGPVPYNYDDYKLANYSKLSEIEKEKKLRLICDYKAHVFKSLEYASWPMFWLPDMHTDGKLSDMYVKAVKLMLEHCDGKYMLHAHGDGTYSIPDGNHMYDFAYRLADDMDGVLADAQKYANWAIENNKRLVDVGIEVLILCADYCYNNGPFVSPKTFSQIVTPYLFQIVEKSKAMGAYVIKHTDGDIMPIMDDMVSCRPHAIHSLDPMANVDIRTVKEKYGSKVALIGNVNCALMQTGTDEEVIESAEYCLKYGRTNGGYIFSTSNVPFKGLPAERYQLILDIWKKHRKY